MDITVLRKEELLLLAAELGMDINSRLRKPEIRAAIEEVGFEEDELTDAWEKICRERNERAEEKEKQEKREQRQAEIELERIKLEQARLARSADAEPPPPAENTWPERLLALLPGEASQVVARLSAVEAGEYSSVKSSLLAKYRLSTEEFRRRFRQERKKSNESFVEFACSLRDNFSEWVQIEGPFGAIETVAAVSKGLPEGYPYLFSNNSESLLNKRGCTFAEAQVMALTRSKARALAQQLRYDDNESVLSKDEVSSSESVVAQEEENPENLEDSRDKERPVEKKKRKSKGKDDSFQGTVLAPTAPSYERLLAVDLTSVELRYFPFKATSVVHPLDQGILNSVKCHGCKRRVVDRFLNLELKREKKINIFMAIEMVAGACKGARQSTIVCCFSSACFGTQDPESAEAALDCASAGHQHEAA
ncbi:hypothetical protein HPB50_003028 [Hyalomma asiaticum]|uniref:Uncharacterized protein n=1 Tax=Hyalomma asiaticum TaxID=266040 RepID=A0ACB7RTW6_HYAAI|nr:hypothetical protein HPB50_003028 [Hyalomma asiaticum]